MMTSPNTRFAAPGLIVGCVVFGMGSLIVKFVPVGAFAIAFWRLAVAAVIFWLLMRAFKQSLPKQARALKMALLSGAFLGLDLAFWHESIYAVGPGISTLLNSLQIFFLSSIGLMFFGERLSKLQIFSLALALAGVIMIASPEFNHNAEASWGFASGILSGVMLALSMVFIRITHDIEKVALFPMMLLISLCGMLALIIPSLLFNSGSLYPVTLRDVGLILIYGAVMQCVAWGLIAYAVPLLSLTLTGLLLLSEPVAALAIDYFWLQKSINALQWIGAALTLLAIYLGSFKPKFA